MRESPRTVLTPREFEVMNLIREGLNQASIARELNISTETVKEHKSRVYRKLNVKTAIEAIIELQRRGYFQCECGEYVVRRGVND